MTKKYLYEYVSAWFQEHIPLAETELHFNNVYELVVAVTLSAQCTDKRVNMITPALFEAYPTVQELAKAEVADIFHYIRSISYPNNKAKHLWGMANMVVKDFNGEIPEAHEDLIKLPGVGRKTANVVGSVAFDQQTMPVDTHVFRVSQRIGLVKPSKTPLEVEKQLLQHVKPEQLGKFHHWLILHGRYTCMARNPQCEKCGLTAVCKYYKNLAKKGLKSNVM
jgi:endonuclease-3